MKLEKENKTNFTLEHAQIFYQTFAEIMTEKYASNVEVKVTVKKK